MIFISNPNICFGVYIHAVSPAKPFDKTEYDTSTAVIDALYANQFDLKLRHLHIPHQTK